MASDDWLSEDIEVNEDEVAIDYLKVPDFRISWLDGALGSITPSGNIQISFYAERPSIPRRQIFKVGEDGETLGAEVTKKRISRESIIRELSVDAMMTADTAKSLGELLIKMADWSNEETKKEIRKDIEE